MIFNNEGSAMHGRRTVILFSIVALLTAVGYFLLFQGSSRNWDGFWMVLFGLGVGGNVGEGLSRRSAAGRPMSDGPGIFGVNLGVAIMAAIWWSSTPELSAFIGAVCRSLAGAYTGAFAVVILTSKPYREHPDQGGGRLDG